jgi:hypothetical protein
MINKVTQVCKEDMLPKVKQENTTSMIKRIMLQGHLIDILITRANTVTNQYINITLEQKQLTYISKNIDASIVESHNKSSSWESYKHNIPQRIELGWSTLLQFDNSAQRLEDHIILSCIINHYIYKNKES